jgi:membrane peptidoglycan carboxypeptidase
MSDSSQRPRRKVKVPKNTYTTSSGKTIKMNRSLSDRVRAGRQAKAQRKAAYLSTLPKEKWKRLLYRLEPKRMYHYWFSRDGAIMALKIAGIGIVVLFLLVVGLFAYFRKDLPKLADINGGSSGGSIAYYDRSGTTLLFQDYGAFKRFPVQFGNISPYMRDATVAIEDKDFFHEGAFSLRGIARAAVNNLKGGDTQGASTISEQLVKMDEGWTGERSVSIKIKELILASELEREYSKDDILNAYLNIAPYSGTDYGVQAAAQDYFHENADQLTLAQSAFLAAIPESPTNYSPYSSPTYNPAASGYYFDENGLLARVQYILQQMQAQGYITKAQATAAAQVNVLAQVQQMPADHYTGIQDPYFIEAAKEQLSKMFPASVIKSGGWKVDTTMSVPLQDLANNVVQSSSNIALINKYGVDDEAFVGEQTGTGEIMAMVGGTNWDTQQVNMAYDGLISPGSSIKPYTYATLINDNNNVGAGSTFIDKEQPLPGYPCTDTNKPEADPNANCLWDDTRANFGTVTLRYALGSSLNIPAVKAFTETDPSDTTTAADGSGWRIPSINNTMSAIDSAMGDSSGGYHCINTKVAVSDATSSDYVQCGAAAGIGNGAYTTLTDHTNGIATLARLGQAIPSTLILKVTNSADQTLYQYKQPKPTQVFKADSAYIVTNMAADPGASYLTGTCNETSCSGPNTYTSSYERFHRYKGWQIAIKTGTNQDLDGLMMSWDTQYTAGVWVGNYDNSPWKLNTQPEWMTDPVMKQWMEGAIDQLGNVSPNNWAQPSDIKVLSSFTGNKPPYPNESALPSTDLFPSWYVGGGKSSGPSYTIDKVSGLLAGSCTPADAKEVIGGGTGISANLNVDIYNGGNPNISGTSSSESTSGEPTSQDNVHTCGDTDPSATITAVNNVATGSSSGLTCAVGTTCTVSVYVQQGTHALSDPAYPQYPGTLNLIVNGQSVDSVSSPSPGDYTLSFTPSSAGSLNITAQVTDSVLDQGSTTQTITVSSSNNNSSGNSSGNGNTTGFLPKTSGGTGGTDPFASDLFGSVYTYS